MKYFFYSGYIVRNTYAEGFVNGISEEESGIFDLKKITEMNLKLFRAQKFCVVSFQEISFDQYQSLKNYESELNGVVHA